MPVLIVKNLSLVAQDNFEFGIPLNWKKLENANGDPCFLWEIEKKKGIYDFPVIYRLIVKHKSKDNNEIDATIYVGEGNVLCIPGPADLREQYANKHGAYRQKVRNYIDANNFSGYTEILREIEGFDLSIKKERKMIEKLLIGSFYVDNKIRRIDDDNYPLFLNNN